MNINDFCKKTNITPEQFTGAEPVGGSLDLGGLTAEKKAPPAVITWQDGRYCVADGIFAEVLHRRQSGDQTIWKLQKINGKPAWMIEEGSLTAHGKSVKSAVIDLRFKASDRDPSDYEGLTPDSVMSYEDAVVCYSGLDRDAWFRVLAKHEPHKENCLFVTIPDVVGNSRRTDDLYYHITQDARTHPYTRQWAFVMQDGHEDSRIDWNAMLGKWMFIGGTDRFKDSAAAYDIVKTAKAMGGIKIHVGRVNTAKRYEAFASLGCDTCDGSGVAQYDYMLDDIAAAISKPPEPTLFK